MFFPGLSAGGRSFKVVPAKRNDRIPVLAKTRDNCGEVGAIRFVHRLSRTQLLLPAHTRSVAEMMSGMIRASVTDRRDFTYVFRGFMHAIVGCPGGEKCKIIKDVCALSMKEAPRHKLEHISRGKKSNPDLDKTASGF